MKTRTQKSTGKEEKFVSLKDIPCQKYPSKICVRFSDLYYAFEDDYIEYVYEQMYSTRESVQHKRQQILDSVQKKEMWIRSVLKGHPRRSFPCGGYFSFSIRKPCTIRWNEREGGDVPRWLGEVLIENRTFHLRGKIDGFYRTESGRVWYPVLFKSSRSINKTRLRWECWVRQKALRGFCWESMDASKFWIVTPKESFLLEVELSREEKRDVYRMMRQIRFCMAWYPHLCLNSTYLPRFLLPNLKRMNSPWYTQKLAWKQTDLTRLYGCYPKHRDFAWKRYGIESYLDPRCSARTLGFSPEQENYRLIQRWLSLYQSETRMFFIPPDIRERFPKWFPMDDTTTTTRVDWLYVDFEYLNSVDSSKLGEEEETSSSSTFLYLIGCYDPRSDEYTSFWADTWDERGQRDVMTRFSDFIHYHYPNPRFVYYYADFSVWRKRCEALFPSRYPYPLLLPSKEDSWMDLYVLYRKSPILFRNTFSFRLKDLANALHSIPGNFTQVDYHSLDCQNGAESIELAQHYYQKGDPLARQMLERYNAMDCRVLYDLHVFLSTMSR